MEGLSFICEDSANVGDFLTGVTAPTDRVVKQEFEHFPRTGSAIQKIYDNSETRKRMQAEYNYPDTAVAKENSVARRPSHDLYRSTISDYMGRQSYVRHQTDHFHSPSFHRRVPLLQRSEQLGGALFFALLYNALVAMSETTDSFTGRPVLAKHKQFAFYHPAAFCIAQITADLPILFVQVTCFSVILYWMVALKATAGAFFIFLAPRLLGQHMHDGILPVGRSRFQHLRRRVQSIWARRSSACHLHWLRNPEASHAPMVCLDLLDQSHGIRS
ncbi:uncharacterized protein PV06_11772 [Exophiala oligosperma]|uniref:ABC-2 type transporter transmembrane domain-containing protein n=1 Tax=Exophiala oligosperma TaxID=215243 RepID=A0A0D2D0Y7_9EURO|nr:uncharacterized protein PV06_11772 [Exophiala oligosperma]KIW35900.1 hypothetical protein PV06_11772 [Exophiala oligosperma]